MNVYFISGLGADERMFARLKLPSFCNAHHIHWIEFHKNETLDHYAKRLSIAIDTSQPFALVGLSLGGMLASEMKEFLRPVKTIIISSVPDNTQLPPYYKWMGFIGLHQFVPVKLYKFPTPFLYWFFGIKTKEEKELFDSVLRDADPGFIKHAVNAVLHWKKSNSAGDIVHIHGTKDKVLPYRFTHPTIGVKDGEHLMVFSKAEELSKILSELLTA